MKTLGSSTEPNRSKASGLLDVDRPRGTPVYGIVGGVVGAYIGAMAAWGVHEQQISRYQQLVEKGKVLVIANGEPLQLTHAHQELKKTVPVELHTYVRSDDEGVESA